MQPTRRERPDAVLDLGEDGQIAVEAAQLHLPTRGEQPLSSMARWAAFEALRSDLMARSAVLAGALRRHAGLTVTVWFQAPGSDSFTLPPKNDPASGLVDLLLSSSPLQPSLIRDGEPIPSTAPVDAVAWSADRSVGVTWGSLPSTYKSTFKTMLGFELALAYSLTFTRSDVRAELQRIVTQHDKPGSEILIISANSTLRSGMYFPSTQLVSELVFADPDPLAGVALSNIRAVALHDPREGHELRWIEGGLH